MRSATMTPTGELGLKLIRKPKKPYSIWQLWKYGAPRLRLPWWLLKYRLKNFPNFWRGFWKVALAAAFGIPTHYGQLELKLTKANGEVFDYGIVSLRVVTDDGVDYITDSFQNSTTTPLDNMQFHGFGTGSTAEDQTDSALVTELTTEYATDNTRPTGTQTENGSNVFETVATLDPDAQVLAREHGILDQASNAGGVLLDRSVYALITVESDGDTLQATYDFTSTAGS